MSASRQAIAAVRGVKNLHRWGHFSTMRFLVKSGVTYDLFRVCVSFEDRRKS